MLPQVMNESINEAKSYVFHLKTNIFPRLFTANTSITFSNETLENKTATKKLDSFPFHLSQY